MKRIQITPRSNWEEKVEKLGLVFHHTQGRPYWNESAYYSFRMDEILRLEKATNDLQRMCLEAAQHVIDKNRFAELGIPAEAAEVIRWAWEAEPPAIYGRFDLAYDGQSAPKLLEYNADTPTSLLEAGVVQWYWLQERFGKNDQWNSIHERLIAKWRDLAPYVKPTLHFAHMDDLEDGMTVGYLRDTAEQAGIETIALAVEDIGWDKVRRQFVDTNGSVIRSIFKLYPWEWMVHEDFGRHALSTYKDVNWIEPIWKMVLSNKGILAILWELFPGHENLLESHLQEPKGLVEYAKKPLLSREGANVTVKTKTTTIERGGDYGEEGYVFQAIAPIPNFDGSHPVIGSWVIDGESAGAGIRESDELITDNCSRFCPHLIEG